MFLVVVLMVCVVIISVGDNWRFSVVLNWNWLNIIFDIVFEFVINVFNVLIVGLINGKVLLNILVNNCVLVIGILMMLVLFIFEFIKSLIIGIVNINIKLVFSNVLLELLKVLNSIFFLDIFLFWMIIVINVFINNNLLGRYSGLIDVFIFVLFSMLLNESVSDVVNFFIVGNILDIMSRSVIIK